VRAALKEQREQAKALKQQLEQAAAEAAELRQWRQQIENNHRQQQYMADERARLQQRNEALDMVFDLDERAQMLERWRQEDLYIAQQSTQQAIAQAQYTQGYETAKEAFPDFEGVFHKAMSDPMQAPLLEAVANQALNQGKNPVIAAYKMAKQLDPEAQAARIEAEVSKRLQAVLQKQNPPANRGHATIGHATSQVPGAVASKDVRDMSTEELERKAGIRR
jgi:hypothetical protein